MKRYLQEYIRDRIILIMIVLTLLYLIGYGIYSKIKISQLEMLNSKLERNISEREKNVVELKNQIKFLTLKQKEVVVKIKTIKVKEHEKIKTVDSMPVSKLQRFFTEKYGR